MTKILFLHFSLRNKGGIGRSLINLLQALPADQYDISLQLVEHGGYFFEQLPPHIHILPLLRQFAPYGKDLIDELHAAGMERAAKVREHIHVRNLELEATGVSPWELHHQNWSVLRKLCPYLPGEYDTAVAFYDTIPLKILGEKVNARRKIGWVHTDYKSYSIPAEHQREYFAKMDAVVSFTPQNAAVFCELFPELAEKSVCLPSLNPHDAIKRQAAEFVPAEYESGVFNIFTAARLCHQKAPDWIVEAAAILKERGLRFRWYIAGPEGDMPAREMAAAAGVEDAVIFLGPLDNPYPYMKHCDLYAQPSRYEGKCLAVLEAMVLGVPVLLTRYPSAADSVTDGVDGMLCDLNPAAIAEAVETLAGDPELRKKLAAGIRMADDTAEVLKEYDKLWEGTL